MINKPAQTIDEKIYQCQKGVEILKKSTNNHELAEIERQKWLELLNRRLLELKKQKHSNSHCEMVESQRTSRSSSIEI